MAFSAVAARKTASFSYARVATVDGLQERDEQKSCRGSFFYANAEASGGAVDWGLGYGAKGTIPTPPSNGAAILEKHSGIYIGDTSKQEVFLSFDLGYEAGYTGEVLDILKENDIKAVFFLCGNYLKERELVERMINEGHEIGNHTDKHKSLPSLSDADIEKDIVDFNEKLLASYPNAKTPRLFRPPSGRFCDRSISIAGKNSLKTVMWSIAIVDWGKTPIDAASSAKKIEGRLHNGAIILLHISNSGTPKMLRQLLPKIAESGYSVSNSCF